MSTIGSVIINLTAGTAQFHKQIEHGVEDLHKLGEAAEGVHRLLEAAFAFVGIEMGIGALKEMVLGTTEAGASAFHLASSLGMTTQALMGLQAAGKMAGLSGEQVTTSLEKMARTLGEAATGGEEASNIYKELGLNAKTLANQPLDKSFADIAEAISKLHNPTERAIALTQIFGRNGAELAPLFAEGAEGIAEAVKKAQEMGFALNDIDAAKLLETHEAIEQVGMKLEGIKNQIIIALAPAITSIADGIMKILPNAETVRNFTVSALEDISIGIGYLVDGFNFVKSGVLAWGVIGLQVFEWYLDGIKKVADALQWASDKIKELTKGAVDFGDSINPPELAEFRDELHATADEMRKSLLDQINELQSHSAVDKIKGFWDGIKDGFDKTAQHLADNKNKLAGPISDALAEAGKKIHGQLEELRKEVATFGMSSGDKKLNDLEKLGANSKQLDEARQLVAELDKMNAQKEMWAEGRRLMEENLNPLQKYNEQMEHLNTLLENGAIGQTTFAAAAKKAHEELEKQVMGDESRRAGAVVRRFSFDMPRQADPSKFADVAKTQADIQKETAKNTHDTAYYIQELWRMAKDSAQGNSDQSVTTLSF